MIFNQYAVIHGEHATNQFILINLTIFVFFVPLW
jgi:hypothetical protein